MTAREQLVKSLSALIVQIDSGGIQDTALPGTPASEATRLMKNGLSVSAFACFEHFVRERIVELLDDISRAPNLPAFEDLPDDLKLAATKGVVDALRYRLNNRNDGLETSDVVNLAQAHAESIVSTKGSRYTFSTWSFGWASSNVGAGTIVDFFRACGAPKFGNEIGAVLREVSYDYSAAGLNEGNNFKLKKVAAWRHEAAHDATMSIDVELLRTRITAYLSVAFAFDLLSSVAVRTLIDSFGTSGSIAEPDRTTTLIQQLVPYGDQFQLQELSGAAVGTYYSPAHCADVLSSTALPINGAVVVKDVQAQIAGWLFH